MSSVYFSVSQRFFLQRKQACNNLLLTTFASKDFPLQKTIYPCFHENSDSFNLPIGVGLELPSLKMKNMRKFSRFRVTTIVRNQNICCIYSHVY